MSQNLLKSILIVTTLISSAQSWADPLPKVINGFEAFVTKVRIAADSDSRWNSVYATLIHLTGCKGTLNILSAHNGPAISAFEIRATEDAPGCLASKGAEDEFLLLKVDKSIPASQITVNGVSQ